MIYIGIFIFVSLTIASLLHVAWAFGIVWPAKDEQALIRTVIGHPDVKKMPGTILTLAVAAGIAIAGLSGLWGGDILMLPLSEWMEDIVLFCLAGVFGLRGLSSYLMEGPLGKRIEPFATLDRRFFAPLCLVLSAGFVILGFG
ncbi:MAG: DUF3995 domain-containing protein [Sneathiella sp.]